MKKVSVPAELSTKRQQLQAASLAGLLFAAFLFVWIANVTESVGTPEDVKFGTYDTVLKGSNQADLSCSSVCDARREARLKAFRGKDLTDRRDLVDLVTSAKDRLIGNLRKDYGDAYFQQMFVDGDTYRPFMPITPGGPSMERLKRKLMIKVLSAQLALRQQDTVIRGCDCTQGGKALPDFVEPHPTPGLDPNVTTTPTGIGAPDGPPFLEKYVWATGGHSAAAGHGNLFNESYTAFMERDLTGVFGSIGIEFEGRNYAMGGTKSAAEVAMCWEQIFGDDVDFFSWDYGMTDGNNAEGLLHYGYRGGLSPGRPAILGVHLGGRSRAQREGALRALEDMGMAAFYGNEESYAAMRDGIPDMEGLNRDDIAQLPEYVRNFKCSGAIENGDPYCGAEKFSDYICRARSRKTGWHPGVKDHAMTGHGMALLLVEALLGALKGLVERETQDAESLLAELRKVEDEHYEKFIQATLPETHSKLYKVGGEVPPDFNTSLFFTGRSLCHTGRTPSQTRYLGILTNTDKVGGVAPFGEETYDVGINVDDALKSPNVQGEMRLAWTQWKEREACQVVCKPDYKDFFLTSDRDDWTKLTIPNEAEKKAYRYDHSQFMGIIVIALRSCDYGKCEKGFLTAENYDEKKWEMKVNGKAVTSVVDIGFEGLIVKWDDGVYFPPNANGDYEIELRVSESGSFVKVSSFILY